MTDSSAPSPPAPAGAHATAEPAPAPRTLAGGAGLAALLTTPDKALVALDYDGTLAPIVSRPSDAVPAPGAMAALGRISRRVGTVAIITGRPVDAVLELTGVERFTDLGHLLVLGQYGLQRWDAETRQTTAPEPLPGVEALRSALPDALHDAPAGTSVEDKRHALVVHVRRTADPDAALAALTPALTRLAEEHGLEAAPGKRVLELRPPGHDKGRALRGLVAERAARSVLVAGDDYGDLPAFEAVDELRAGGLGAITVCSDSPEVPDVLRERADLVVSGPTGMVTLLEVLADRLGA
ncbi:MULTISPECIES: trehalose-phosphatase [Parafrankia]|uniref:Trehalose 6-phosphate phosphatase n=1 Tax=Parafrankia soli TaxID=2599596 RepID=A0A1S1R1M6_9ACTN|nr:MULTISPECIES: trehalose-phosphatase [Parafrankia]OHV40090.1 trehalose-phosphatase [Parafrankia soli]TCJ33631.1 trehalose-phosphatase [Parafrankia sp. BMG5.11]CAI7978549.1 Trehalose 6-phosphate phosphatase [Frankia sp. Hr75.2]SQD93644.1 HAD-superfamily hydrolase, subfamily IIB [Parafrankia sp. Ea1.12]